MMKRQIFQILTVCSLVLTLPVCVSAQSLGDIGSGNTGSGNTGGSSSPGGNLGSSSGNSSSGTASAPSSEFGTTVDTPTFQGFQDTSSQTFIGRDSSVPFIGREDAFNDRQTATNNKRTTTAASTTRRTTSSRMTSSRTMSSRTGLSSSNNGRNVRAAAAAEFELSPMEVNNRTTEFQQRIVRLPNLRVIPEQVGVQLESTPQGNVATLTGIVPSERERKVMKQLLLLEPGVDKVENKLTVSGN